MIFLNILIRSIFVASGVTDGWYPVEKTAQPTEQHEEDPTIWVLFSKSLDDEKFLVRMPGDPTYRYSDSGAFELSSEKEGQLFQLTIEENGPEREDLHYQAEGKWVHEHSVRSGSHYYHFKTSSDASEISDHETFISSFLIEKNG